MGFIAAVLGVTICACWVVPYRLRFGPGGSSYSFGFIGDEYCYAYRIQPLLPSATASNPVNGFGDRTLISQMFLEDGLRLFLSITHIPVNIFFWAWRIIFPCCLTAALYFLAQSAIVGPKLWLRSIRLAAVCAALVFLYGCAALTMMRPEQNFIDRVPSNAEYPVSIFLAALFLRFCRNPELKWGLAVSATSVGLVYLRPYGAMPWGLTIVACMLALLVSRRINLRLASVMAATVVLGLAPWVGIGSWNNSSPVQAELLRRYFISNLPYTVHPRQFLFLGVAALLGLSALWVDRRCRAWLLCAALTMAALPYICGLFSIASELLTYDRFGGYYIAVLISAGMLLVAEQSGNWRGWNRWRNSLRYSVLLSVAGLGGALLLANYYFHYDLVSHGPYPFVVTDSRYLPAYGWIRRETPADALFMVDEGFDFSQMPSDPAENRGVEAALYAREEDLFLLAAQRRRVYCERLRQHGLSNNDLYELAMLHRGTFGLPIDYQTYLHAFTRFEPNYIFWRKLPAVPLSDQPAPIPRGYASKLQPFCEIVYSDPVSEIWKIDYSKIPHSQAKSTSAEIGAPEYGAK